MFTSGNVDDRVPLKEEHFTEGPYGKISADRGHISKDLTCKLFANGIQLITMLTNKIKNSLMDVADKVLLRKRAIIESVHVELKNMALIEHSKHESLHNFINNLVADITAYNFF